MTFNWRPYLLPGLVFQSVIIGGGYATGRELVEFFMPSGALGGLLGIAVAGLVFALVMATAYEYARITGTRDYRSFSRSLLGRAWVVYEAAYLALIVLILAVIGAASGELIASATRLNATAGTVVLMLLISALTFWGSGAIARVLATWSVLLYLTYFALFVLTLESHGARIQSVLSQSTLDADFVLPGVRYASYNISLPAVLFCMALLTRRRETIGAGLMTGVIAVVPAMLFYVSLLSQYPEIAAAPVPALALMAELSSPWLQTLFQVVVFGTFVETGTALLHSVNERIDVHAHERGHQLPRWARPAIAAALLLASIYGATAFGIVDLIARGYGALSWIFIVILILPLMTVGLWRTVRSGRPDHAPD
jgi:uncharacterized membrane protein YkvI